MNSLAALLLSLLGYFNSPIITDNSSVPPIPATFDVECTLRCNYKDGPAGSVCAAPAYVHIDCTPTTHTDTNVRTFHDLRWSINFADSANPSGQGTWNYGKDDALHESRNVERSPIAAHAYETAGTYQILATACDSTGACATNAGEDSITITAEDTAWSAANTRCISRTTDFTGCPAAVTDRVTSTSYSSTTVLTTAGKRTLFKCGDTFTATANFSLSDVNGNGSLIGGFGTCTNNPVLVDFTADSALHDGTGLGGWRVRDIAYTKTTGTSADGIWILRNTGSSQVTSFLALRMKTLQTGACSQPYAEDNVLLNNSMTAWIDYDCTMTRPRYDTSWQGQFGGCSYCAWLGTREAIVSPGYTLGWRFMGVYKSIIAHGEYSTNSQLGAGTLSFRHAPPASCYGQGDCVDASTRLDQYMVFRDVLIAQDSTSGFWSILLYDTHGQGTAPFGESARKDDIIIESTRIWYGNTWRTGSNPMYHSIVVDGNIHNVTVRNSIIDRTNVPSNTGETQDCIVIWSADNGTHRGPINVDVINNLCINRNVTNTTQMCNRAFSNAGQAVPAGTGSTCRNNINYSMAKASADSQGNFPTTSNNLMLQSTSINPFCGTLSAGLCTGTIPTTTADTTTTVFKLTTTANAAAALGTGFTFPDSTIVGKMPYNYRDYGTQCRGGATGGDVAWDRGPWERDAISCD